MNDPIDTRLRQLAQELHDAAPAAPEWNELAADTTSGAPRGARRWLAAATAAALVVALTAAIVAVRSVDHHAAPAPISTPLTADGSTSTASPTSTTNPATTTSTTAAETTTLPATTSTAPVALTWGDVAAQRTAALAAFDSVSFTAVVTETYDGHPEMDTERTNDVTLLADGTLWATGDTYIFNSYDPSTGVARVEFRQQDGTSGYQELVGQTDNSVPLLVMLGSLDPTGASWSPDAAVTAASANGREEWQITDTFGGQDGGPAPQTNSWTIDRSTGLIIRHQQDWSYDDRGDRARRTVVLSDVRTGVDLPAEFPGTFPDGANVDRSGDPKNRPLTLDEAAAEFGDGFVEPNPLPAGMHVTIETIQTTVDDPSDPTARPTIPMVEIELTIPQGFTRSTITLWKIPVPAAGPPAGFVVVGDAVCRSADGATCVEDGTGDTMIGAGAWAGVTGTRAGSSFAGSRDGIRLFVSAGTPEAAMALADSLA